VFNVLSLAPAKLTAALDVAGCSAAYWAPDRIDRNIHFDFREDATSRLALSASHVEDRFDWRVMK
jgi:hypothetical protein